MDLAMWLRESLLVTVHGGIHNFYSRFPAAKRWRKSYGAISHWACHLATLWIPIDNSFRKQKHLTKIDDIQYMDFFISTLPLVHSPWGNKRPSALFAKCCIWILRQEAGPRPRGSGDCKRRAGAATRAREWTIDSEYLFFWVFHWCHLVDLHSLSSHLCKLLACAVAEISHHSITLVSNPAPKTRGATADCQSHWKTNRLFCRSFICRGPWCKMSECESTSLSIGQSLCFGEKKGWKLWYKLLSAHLQRNESKPCDYSQLAACASQSITLHLHFQIVSC